MVKGFPKLSRFVFARF